MARLYIVNRWHELSVTEALRLLITRRLHIHITLDTTDDGDAQGCSVKLRPMEPGEQPPVYPADVGVN